MTHGLRRRDRGRRRRPVGATSVAPALAPSRRPSRVRGRRQGALLRLRADIPRSLSLGLGVAGLVVLLGGWWLVSSTMGDGSFLVASPGGDLAGLPRPQAVG